MTSDQNAKNFSSDAATFPAIESLNGVDSTPISRIHQFATLLLGVALSVVGVLNFTNSPSIQRVLVVVIFTAESLYHFVLVKFSSCVLFPARRRDRHPPTGKLVSKSTVDAIS